MLWDLLTSDEEAMIIKFARRSPIVAKICLKDNYCYEQCEEVNCIDFLEVVGEWLRANIFACTLDVDMIPSWVEDESTRSDTWMRFALRKKVDGSLILPDGTDGGQWVKVGHIANVSIPVSRWHGVMKKTSETSRYNCIFYDGVNVHEGSDEDVMPGYHISINTAAKQRPCRQSEGDSFNAVFELD